MVTDSSDNCKQNGPLKMREAVTTYLAQGWSVFPLQEREKIPAAALLPEERSATGETVLTASGRAKRSWRVFQERQPVDDEVAAWFAQLPGMNVAIVCGAVSGIIVLDIDSEEGETEAAMRGLPVTVTARTGKGRHLYFKHPGERLGNFAGKLPGIDLRGDGGYVVGPPSVHPSGAVYAWEPGRGPGEVPLAAMPGWLLALARGDDKPVDRPTLPGTGGEDLPEDYYEAIARALGVKTYDGKGWSNFVRDPIRSHEHDHISPAAQWHRDRKILKCFKCHGEGEWYLARDVAAALGVDWREYTSRRPGGGDRGAATGASAATARQGRDQQKKGAGSGAPLAAPGDVIMAGGEEEAGGERVTPVLVANLLARIQQSKNGQRAGMIGQAAAMIAEMPAVHRVELRRGLKAATGYTLAEVDAILRDAGNGGAVQAATGGVVQEQYSVLDGNLVRLIDEENALYKIVANFTGEYVAETSIDYGDEWETALIANLRVKLQDGREYEVAVPAEDTAETRTLFAAIRGAAGVAATVEANELRHLGPGLDALTDKAALTRQETIAHTGWVKSAAGWAFVTPGGVVGDLPDGVQVMMMDDFKRERVDLRPYRVADDGDEAMTRGVRALMGLLGAFEPDKTYPSLGYAFLPPLERWLGERQKMVLHLVGRTGTLKTSFAQTVMSLYGGDWVYNKPLMMWESTVNSIERGGFPLCNVLALVDDYKPEVTQDKQIVSFIQRYSSGNVRGRMNRNSKLMAERPFRGWLLSTGEDLPSNVPSVMARTISLRFTPRPAYELQNSALMQAQNNAAGLPTVMARYIGWLAAMAETVGEEEVTAKLRTEALALRSIVVGEVPEAAPNRDRIAENITMLMIGFRWMRRFLAETGAISKAADDELDGFDVAQAPGGAVLGYYAKALIEAATTTIVSERPSQIFLETLQALIVKRQAYLVGRDRSVEDNPMNVVGWFDYDGTVYLSGGAYEDVARYLRQAGREIGSSRNELYRLMQEEGLLADTGGGSTTKAVRCQGQSVRCLVLRPGVLEVRDTFENGDEEE